MIAAPCSGSGKTLLSLCLAALAHERGIALQPFKVGPDYLDPQLLAAVAGRPCRNLDTLLCGPEWVRRSFVWHGSRAQQVLVEGVMGLFDGRGPSSDGSTAEVATLLGLPVLLVVEASRQAGSLAALVRGFRDHGPPAVRLVGVVLNRVGSERHQALLREALQAIAVPLLGVLPQHPALELPSRHLGLLPPQELVDLGERRRLWAELARRHLDLERLEPLLAPPEPVEAGTPDPIHWVLARAAPDMAPGQPIRGLGGEIEGEAAPDPAGLGAERLASLLGPPGATAAGQAVGGSATLSAEPPGQHAGPTATSLAAVDHNPQQERALEVLAALGASAARGSGPPLPLAIPSDRAFHFRYPEAEELLRAVGLQPQPWSPLADEPLPPGCRGVILPGGYPELHAAQLAASRRSLGDLAVAAGAGLPILAECGGLLLLGQQLHDAADQPQPMAGILPFSARRGALSLGYRQARALADGLLMRRGESVVGHEFHRWQLWESAVDETPPSAPEFQLAPWTGGPAGAVAGEAPPQVAGRTPHNEDGRAEPWGGEARGLEPVAPALGRLGSGGSGAGGSESGGPQTGQPSWAWSALDASAIHGNEPMTTARRLWQLEGWGSPLRPEGWTTTRIHATWLHLHWAGCPVIPWRLAAASASAVPLPRNAASSPPRNPVRRP